MSERGTSGLLLHIRPQILAPWREVTLTEFVVEPFGLHLRGGTELMTKRPYPDKNYAVGCRKGRKPIKGILIEAAGHVEEFHTTARWVITPKLTVTHHVHYTLLDHELDAASDDMTLWNSTSEARGGWTRRWAAWAEDLSPMAAAPIMEVIDNPHTRLRRVMREDLHDSCGRIVERNEDFPMLTVEPEKRPPKGALQDRQVAQQKQQLASPGI
jgi:hypothetical protein